VGHALPEINPLMGIIPGLKAFVRPCWANRQCHGAMLAGSFWESRKILLVALMPELAGYRDGHRLRHPDPDPSLPAHGAVGSKLPE